MKVGGKIFLALLAAGVVSLGAAADDSRTSSEKGGVSIAPADRASISSTAKWLSALPEDDDKLISKVRHFLGKERNVNSDQQGVIAEQVIEHIAVPAEPFTVRLPDGYWLATGNVPKAGDAKGAVLIDQSGSVRGAALMEFSLTGTALSDEIWIYVANDPFADAYISDIKKWPAISPGFGFKVFKLGRAK